MQPTNKPRPVMDVTARSRPPASSVAAAAPERPTQPLPLHEPPANSEDAQTNPGSPASAPATAAAANPRADSDESKPAPAHEQSKPPAPSPVGAKPPVGVIVATVLVMLVLSAAAIMIYLQ